jgi:hypothetical protein
MLRLFFIGSKVDWDDGKITTTCLPTNMMEYNNILSQPTTIRATQAANIVHTIFMTFPKKNEEQFLSLFSMLSMELFPKTLVTAWLNANFQRPNLESLLFESNAITVLCLKALLQYSVLWDSNPSLHLMQTLFIFNLSKAHNY